VIGFGSATPAAAAANTPGQEAIDNLFGIVLLFAVAIVIFVQVLLVIVVFRFRKRKGHTQSVPNPITHHTGLEAAWTIVPALILLFVGIMTFQTLAVTDTIPQNPDVVVRVIGHQWFWEFVVDDGSGAVPVEVPDTIVAQMPRGGLDRMTAHPVEVEGVLGRDPTGRPRIRARRVRFLGAPIDGVKEVRA